MFVFKDEYTPVLTLPYPGQGWWSETKTLTYDLSTGAYGVSKLSVSCQKLFHTMSGLLDVLKKLNMSLDYYVHPYLTYPYLSTLVKIILYFNLVLLKRPYSGYSSIRRKSQRWIPRFLPRPSNKRTKRLCTWVYIGSRFLRLHGFNGNKQHPHQYVSEYP